MSSKFSVNDCALAEPQSAARTTVADPIAWRIRFPLRASEASKAAPERVVVLDDMMFSPVDDDADTFESSPAFVGMVTHAVVQLR